MAEIQKRRKAKKKVKKHKIMVSLSEKDYELLKYYATQKGTTKAILAKQMLHTELQLFKESIGGELPEKPAKNQLTIFDAIGEE